MKNIKDLEDDYIERFGDLFPTIGISRDYEKRDNINLFS